MIENDKYFALVNTVQLAKRKKSTIYFNKFIYLFIVPAHVLEGPSGRKQQPKRNLSLLTQGRKHTGMEKGPYCWADPRKKITTT